MNSSRLLRTVAFKRKSRGSTFFSIRAVVLLLSFSVAAKTLEQELTFKDEGREFPIDSQRNIDDLQNADDDDDAHGHPGDATDRQNAMNLLSILSAAREPKGFGGSRRPGEVEEWLNRQSLRLWGERGARHKPALSSEDGGLLGPSVDGTRMSDDDALMLAFKAEPSGTRREQDSSNPHDDFQGKFADGNVVFPFDDLASRLNEVGAESRSFDLDGGFNLTAMPRRPGWPGEKRTWQNNPLRVWGKRNSGSDFDEDRLTHPDMRRRKWENLPLRVWGK